MSFRPVSVTVFADVPGRFLVGSEIEFRSYRLVVYIKKEIVRLEHKDDFTYHLQRSEKVKWEEFCTC